MSVDINILQEEPVILFTIQAPIDGENDARVTSEKAIEFAEELGQPVYRIVDFSQVDVTFTDIVMGMSAGAGVPADLVQTYMVGSHALVKLAAESSAQEQYGGIQVYLYASVDEALDDIRAQY